MEAQKNGGILLEKVKKNDYFCKKNMETDTIREGLVFHLGGPVEIAGTVDKETGNANYRIAIVPDEVTVVENNDSQNSHIFYGWELRLRVLLPCFLL